MKILKSERRAERLRPEQLRKLREEVPLAYLPLGILEWHGPHNPLGLDALKAHSLCVRAAERTGGVVFPAVYWGPPPASNLVDTDYPDPYFAETLGVPPKNFTPGAFDFGTRHEQWELYFRVLNSALRSIARYGFEAIFALAGHAQLNHAHHVTTAIERDFGIPVLLAVESKLDPSAVDVGDHGGPWETSLTMMMDPDTVDKKLFPKSGEPNPPGVSKKPLLSELTDEKAGANLDYAIEGMVKAAEDLLKRRVWMKDLMKKRLEYAAQVAKENSRR